METRTKICPVWVGYLLASPLRRLQQNPEKILAPYIQPGFQVLEIGPAMGFFSLPMARMLNGGGKLYCADIQKSMLEKLQVRAKRQALDARIELIHTDSNSLQIRHLEDRIDFCLLAFVVHEVPRPMQLFMELAAALKPGAKILFIEPKGHVTRIQWERSLELAQQSGFCVVHSGSKKGSWVGTLVKAGAVDLPRNKA